jgi:quercetin dioxygenase-like cupin family protein
MAPNWCEKDHYGYMLEGIFELKFENEILIYNSGDGFFIPAGSEHRHVAKVISEKVRVIFVEDI